MGSTIVLAVGLVAFLFMTVPAWADVFHLKNGDTMEGEIVTDLGDAYVVKIPYGTTTIQKKDIARIEKKIFIHEPESTREYIESVRAYGVVEIGSFFAEAGLDCIAVYGSYTGESYSPKSPRLIMIGQKI